MYLLDTNILSELRKFHNNTIDENVRKWFEQIMPSQTYISVISLMEIQMGISLKKRKDVLQAAHLQQWFNDMLLPLYQTRTLPINAEIALSCAELHIPNRRSLNDTLIATTAIQHKLTLVTRNTKDFQGLKLRLLNPFEPH
ncbi:twitching motility protein PilT [[Actinobacillus] muris]|uniref:Twitching motility protein PilT n=1 Tax=Muribacter muris TaxID=67855 RepID=A0A0J5P588_9PAST|nr:type II toxin-antitoxin system VapC family toxin [Muribacter muris]KMK51578.1 twitching motility protein PilT [[Actinobacillus] muris] [Muribacter muris]